ncbi:MAG: tyrosine--tRNA ligase, partial [Verrucomicrobiales bacterium]|nr:tyrosine--tRNA ligase [Verrucomicrobiales bacterium]
EGRPLRAKLGVDPTAPDLHLGHTVPFEKLRQFQQLGHQAVLIIGDFTAAIGDPSGKSKTRPPLDRESIMVNAKTYTDQAFKILDPEKTEVVFNGDWFNKMTYADVIKLNSQVTMQQMLQREDFKNRIAKNQEVRLHEIQYPIVQGWDSVVVKADVEIGGTDQLFNILVGRDLQKTAGMPGQVAMLVPLLEGLDGIQKMSKSLNNYVGVTDTPDDMFGKLMSVSDELMARYDDLLLGGSLDSNIHPMEAKKTLAATLVTRYHSAADAQAARQTWEEKFSNRDASAGAAEFDPNTERRLIATVAAAYQQAFDKNRSNGDIRRLIQQGSIQLDGEKLTDPKSELPTDLTGKTLRLDKKHAVVFS